MKKVFIIQTFYLFLTVFTVTVMSCQKDSIEPVMELTIDSKQKVLTVEKNGVGIEFCLLNENGEPATVFYEGENFRFHMAIKNNVEPDTAMYIVSDFLINPGLFRVFSNTVDTIGKPVDFLAADLISLKANKIKQGEKWVMEIPWHETRGSEAPFDYHNLIWFLHHYFIGLNQPPLSKGTYYTKFTQQFCLGKYLPHPQSESVCTDTLQLKINFEIK
ncbi:hypothetical protein ES705_27786 [subsurface metagenome]